MSRFRPASLLVALAAAGACAPAYRPAADASPPPDSATADAARRGGEAAAGTAPAPGGPVTIVGTVGPDGGLRADTLAGARADTSRVRRETVLTGAVRGPADLPPATELATGFRVQVFAAEDEATAGAVAARVRERAGGSPVYLERDGSWFKVRVGDFATREAAEPLRRELAQAGFPEAWTVQTTIRTVP